MCAFCHFWLVSAIFSCFLVPFFPVFHCSYLEKVANFRLNFLSHCLINFENSCDHFAANILNFSKHTQLLHLKKKLTISFLEWDYHVFFLLNCQTLFQMHPKCIFKKNMEICCKMSTRISKLIKIWLRKLCLKFATPSRKEQYLQLSVYLSKLGLFLSLLDRKQVVGGIWFCIRKWTLCRCVCTSQLLYYEILKCNKR